MIHRSIALLVLVALVAQAAEQKPNRKEEPTSAGSRFQMQPCAPTHLRPHPGPPHLFSPVDMVLIGGSTIPRRLHLPESVRKRGKLAQ